VTTSLTISLYMNTGWVDLTNQILNAGIDQPFDRVNDKFLAGTCSFVFTDENGDWSPENTASPYYGYIVPMVPVKFVATHEATSYALYYGFIDSWKYRPANGGEVANMTVHAVDSLARLAQATVTTLASYSTACSTGYRIQGVYNTLAALGWYPTTATQIGQTIVQDDVGTLRTALDVITQAVESEFGVYFQDNTGVLRFYDRTYQWTQAATTPYYFYDNGNSITYQDTAFSYDTNFLYNDVVVQGYYYRNYPSITSYGQRTLNYASTNCYYYYDVEGLGYTLAIGRSIPILRTQYITLDISPGQPTARITAGLDMYFYDPLSVTRTVPGGSTITKNLVCCSLTYTFRPGNWTVKIGTFEPDLAGFVLDSATMGKLDTNQLVY